MTREGYLTNENEGESDKTWQPKNYPESVRYITKVVEGHATDNFEKYDKQAKAFTAYFFGKLLTQYNEQLFQKIRHFILQDISELNRIESTYCLYGLQALGYLEDDILHALITRIAYLAENGEFRAQDITITLLTLAKIPYKDDRLYDQFSRIIKEEYNQLEIAKNATLIKQFSVLDYYNEDLLDVLCNKAIKSVQHAQPNQLVQLTLGLSNLRYHNVELFYKIGDKVVKQSFKFSAPQLCHIAYAFARLNHIQNEVFNFIAQVTRQKLGQLDTTNLSMLAWSFAQTKQANNPLFTAISKEFKARDTNDFTPQSLVVLMWSFAYLGFEDDELAAKISNAILRDVDQLDSRSLVRVLWSQQALAYVDPQIISKILEIVQNDVGNLPTFTLIQLAWSLGKLGTFQKGLMDQLIIQLYTNHIDQIYEIRDDYQLNMLRKALSDYRVFLNEEQYETIPELRILSQRLQDDIT